MDEQDCNRWEDVAECDEADVRVERIERHTVHTLASPASTKLVYSAERLPLPPVACPTPRKLWDVLFWSWRYLGYMTVSPNQLLFRGSNWSLWDSWLSHPSFMSGVSEVSPGVSWYKLVKRSTLRRALRLVDGHRCLMQNTPVSRWMHCSVVRVWCLDRWVAGCHSRITIIRNSEGFCLKSVAGY